MRHAQAVSILAIAAAIAATAASGETGWSDIRACAAIASDAERLACFDAAAADLPEGAVAVPEYARDPVRDFGLSDHQLEELRPAAGAGGRAAEPEASIEIVSTITDVYERRDGSRLFILENGQIWQETQAGRIRGSIREGASATIREGGIGGYRMEVADRGGFLGVRRIR